MTGDPRGHAKPAWCARSLRVCFSPDGSKIATASGSAAPFLWEAKTGRAIGDSAGHDGRDLGRRV